MPLSLPCAKFAHLDIPFDYLFRFENSFRYVMGFLGFLLQLAIAGYVAYMGYNFEVHYLFLALAPLGFMIGHMVRKTNSKQRFWGGNGSNVLGGIFKSYLVGAVLTVIFFGLGYGIFHILELRPPPEIGRYDRIRD